MMHPVFAVNSTCTQSAEQSKKTLAFFLLGAMAETSLETLSGQASSLMQVQYVGTGLPVACRCFLACVQA